MMTDPISDLLTRIRNAYLVHKTTVEAPASKMKFSVAKILEKEGYLLAASEETRGAQKVLKLTLKYEHGQPVLHTIKRVSTPGRRVYAKATALPRVLSDLGVAIISTPNGLMTNKEARKRKLGGEVICEVS